ncbi:MAG: NUDIX domain-containing protein [Bacteroidales bacterium]
MSYTYEYPRPAVTVDCLIFRKEDESTLILLIQRGQPPFKGEWALPGGFVDIDESLEKAAQRELKEETNLEDIPLKQFKAYGKVDRDPRGRTISIVYYGFTDDYTQMQSGSDAANAKWWPIDNLPKLAFDHKEIVEEAIDFIINQGHPYT